MHTFVTVVSNEHGIPALKTWFLWGGGGGALLYDGFLFITPFTSFFFIYFFAERSRYFKLSHIR